MPIIDPRDRDLAKVLVRHSVKAKKGELVFIQAIGTDTTGLALAVAEETMRVGATPYVDIVEPEIQRAVMRGASEDIMKRRAKFELLQMKDSDCYIGIRGPANSFEYADVPAKQLRAYSTHVLKPVHLEERVKRTRWCVLRYPNAAMSQMAQQSREQFAEFYYRVCCVDYAMMGRAVQPLQKLMEKTDRVHIKGPSTDLEFSIAKIPVIPCSGTHNIPDGECFTAPVKKSINGVVQFNTPTIWQGAPFENVKLVFKDGRAAEATAASKDQTRRLNAVLDQDEGARYVGEFAVGYNPHVKEPMRDILFDEKICGSFHMALGQAYEDADNGNRSAVHWDLVCIQRKDYGGGEMHFDGKLIRKDGQFVPKSLHGLNPEAFNKKKARGK